MALAPNSDCGVVQGRMARFETYRHSGGIGTFGLPLALIGGLAVAIAGAYAYQLFLAWVPFIYITFLGMLAFGAAIGFVVGSAMWLGKTRNLALAAVVGGLCGLVGDAASFKLDYDYRVAQAAEAASEELGTPVTADELAEEISYSLYIETRAEQGYSLGSGGDGGLPISGILVYLIWLIELVCIVGLAIYLARQRIQSPFCEKCQEWMIERHVGAAESVDEDALESAVSNREIESVLEPRMRDGDVPGTPKTALYSMFQCMSCDRSDYLTVNLRWHELGKKDEPEEKSKTLVDHVIVSPEQVETLEKNLEAY